jgi:hypothetical protein
MSVPKRPKDQKRDVFEATTRFVDSSDDNGKSKAAQWLGQMGGKACAKALSPERRREIAKKAAKTRWGRA